MNNGPQESACSLFRGGPACPTGCLHVIYPEYVADLICFACFWMQRMSVGKHPCRPAVLRGKAIFATRSLHLNMLAMSLQHTGGVYERAQASVRTCNQGHAPSKEAISARCLPENAISPACPYTTTFQASNCFRSVTCIQAHLMGHDMTVRDCTIRAHLRFP